MTIRAAAIAVLLGLGCGQALAQPGWYRDWPQYDGIPPHQVMRVVRASGLTPVSRPVLAGPNYVVDAIDRNGEMRRVVVDAEFGDIVRVRPLDATARRPMPQPPGAWNRPPRPPAGFDQDEVATLPPGGPPSRWQPGPPPRPRGDVPGARAPGGPPDVIPAVPHADLPDPADYAAPHQPPHVGKPRTAAVTPARPPLPKPRPALPPAEPAVAKPDAAPTPQQAAAPRVVLPGGPTAKNDRAAEAAKAAASGEPQAPASAASTSDIPPAQSFE